MKFAYCDIRPFSERRRVHSLDVRKSSAPVAGLATGNHGHTSPRALGSPNQLPGTVRNDQAGTARIGGMSDAFGESRC